eukprot:273051-Rhodomonas_salina.2
MSVPGIAYCGRRQLAEVSVPKRPGITRVVSRAFVPCSTGYWQESSLLVPADAASVPEMA